LFGGDVHTLFFRDSFFIHFYQIDIFFHFLLFIHSIKLRIINKYKILNNFFLYCCSDIMDLKILIIKIKNMVNDGDNDVNFKF